MLSETKFDESFPNSQFFAEGYRKVRRDRIMNRGGLLLYVKENIPSKLVITCCFSEENEAIALEFSISNKKWLLPGILKPPAENDFS